MMNTNSLLMDFTSFIAIWMPNHDAYNLNGFSMRAFPLHRYIASRFDGFICCEKQMDYVFEIIEEVNNLCIVLITDYEMN